MSFTLYNAPQSTCSQRVRFVLNAKKISFAEIKLDLLAGDQLKPDYLALNPNGVVPTLDHDGAIVIDSSVIIEYLDEVVPTPERFTPRDPVMRARMRALMRFIDEMPAAAVRVPTFNLAFLPRFAAMSEEKFLAFAESKPLRKEFMLTMGRKGFPQKEMDAPAARPALVRRHSRAPGVSTDISSGLAAYGAISAFALSRVKATAYPAIIFPGKPQLVTLRPRDQPAMAAGVTSRLSQMSDVVDMLEAFEARDHGWTVAA